MYRDRAEAGQALVPGLLRFAPERPLVLALPRGGVPVAYPVARALGAELDVWVARKLGAPGHPEFGLGAIAEGGALYVNWDDAEQVGVPREAIEAVARAEAGELARRARLFRGGRPPPALRGRTVILVDDGIATGGTVKAAVQGVRRGGPARLVLAAPVAAASTLEELAPTVDALVCPLPSRELYAVGQFYEDFAQTTDAEVLELLERAGREQAGAPAGPG